MASKRGGEGEGWREDKGSEMDRKKKVEEEREKGMKKEEEGKYWPVRKRVKSRCTFIQATTVCLSECACSPLVLPYVG